MVEHASVRSRSWLFTPATRPDRFVKAATSGADVMILDLEDAVAPADKDRAREAALVYLAEPWTKGGHRALRINGLGTLAGIADLAALLASTAEPDFLVLPKTESAAHLRILDSLLAASKKPTGLVALIESARGLAAAREVACATPRLAAMMFGAADMAADLGAATAWEPLLHARGALVAAAALGCVMAVDAPYFDVRDPGGLQRETAAAVALGFAAKAAIHPTQVAAINAALTPSDEDVARARAILAENEKGVGTIGGQMIDEAVARKARRTIAAGGSV
jgi:(S)-citramalyl-CoA lyase